MKRTSQVEVMLRGNCAKYETARTSTLLSVYCSHLYGISPSLTRISLSLFTVPSGNCGRAVSIVEGLFRLLVSMEGDSLVSP